MSQVWDKAKIRVPDRIRTYDLLTLGGHSNKIKVEIQGPDDVQEIFARHPFGFPVQCLCYRSKLHVSSG